MYKFTLTHYTVMIWISMLPLYEWIMDGYIVGFIHDSSWNIMPNLIMGLTYNLTCRSLGLRVTNLPSQTVGVWCRTGFAIWVLTRAALSPFPRRPSTSNTHHLTTSAPSLNRRPLPLPLPLLPSYSFSSPLPLLPHALLLADNHAMRAPTSLAAESLPRHHRLYVSG